jgi:hypothetical protein
LAEVGGSVIAALDTKAAASFVATACSQDHKANLAKRIKRLESTLQLEQRWHPDHDKFKVMSQYC